MLDEKDDVVDNEFIEEVDNVQIGDMVVDIVGFDACNKIWNKYLLMLHLSSKLIEHFKRK